MPTVQLDGSFKKLVELYMPETDGRSDFSIDNILEEKGDVNGSVQKPKAAHEWEYGRFREDVWRAHMLREETAVWLQERDARTSNFIVRREFNGKRFVKRIKRATDKYYQSEKYRINGHEVDMMNARPEIPYIIGAPISLQVYVDLHGKIYVDPASNEVFFPDSMHIEVPRYLRTHSNEEPQTRARVKEVKRPYDLQPKKKFQLIFPVDSHRPVKNNPKLRQGFSLSTFGETESDPPILKNIPWTYHAPPGKPGKVNLYQ